MKFRHEIVIDADQQSVWEAFDDPANNKVTLIDTVTERREPHFMAGTCESNVGNALIVNHFEDAGDGRTRWAMYGNHSFSGIFRFLGIFYAGSIRKRNEDMMHNFKLFAETKQAERNE